MEWNDTRSALEELESMGQGYTFLNQMMVISDAASRGDSRALQLLETMLERCEEKNAWSKTNNFWCSMTLKALAHSRTPESMKIILGFIRRLPDTTPFGAVDLLSSILPMYSRFIHGPARELLEDKKSAVCRAIGMQTLCNLYIEGSLHGDYASFLEKLAKNFQEDRYLTRHHVDLVRSVSGQRKRQKSSTDTDGMSGLVEAGSADRDVDAAQEKTEQEIMDSILNMLDE